MKWVNLTVTDLYNTRAAPIIEAAEQTVLHTEPTPPPAQANPIPSLIAQVQAEIRGAVGFSGQYSLDGDPTPATDPDDPLPSSTSIPPNLKDLAVNKIVRECKARLEMPLNDWDRMQEQQYQKIITALLEGKYPVDAPDIPADDNPSVAFSGAKFFRGNRRNFDACDTSGL